MEEVGRADDMREVGALQALAQQQEAEACLAQGRQAWGGGGGGGGAWLLWYPARCTSHSSLPPTSHLLPSSHLLLPPLTLLLLPATSLPLHELEGTTLAPD